MLKRARRDEFFFLFGYDPTYWRGLRKHGLIDAHAGVRLIQCLFTPRHRCFNQFAVPGGCLHREVWARRRPLLIDRGCGGINYEDYPFDKELMDAYAHRLGDRFLGVQLHEWDCNTANDWDRISRRWPKEKPIELPFLHEAFDWRTPATCLETGDPHDFVGRKFPQTQGDFHRDCERFFRRKLRDFHGYLTNVPAPGLSFAQPLRWGARVAMPEYGHHGPVARLHAAAARGAVKQEGRGSIGSYFAPWANSPDSVTCHTNFTLWYSPAEALCGDAFKWRGNGGCSRAFQRRLFWWSYLAGSRFLAEEWGPENTFFDWKDFDLTSYGQVVTDFLLYVRSHGRGRLVTPTAIVLDREYAGLDCVFLAGWRQKPWGFYEATPHQQSLAEFFRQLIGYRNSPPNDNARVLPASPMPDAFDIVLDDASQEFLSRYAVLAYVGEHPGRFLRKMRGYTGELLMLDEPLRTAKAVTEATLARLPLRVEGPAHWLLCRKGGALQVAVFNPHGVTTDSRKGEQSDPKAAAYVTIAAPAAAGRARLIYGWPKETSIRAAKGHVDLMVGPGGLAIVELPLQCRATRSASHRRCNWPVTQRTKASISPSRVLRQWTACVCGVTLPAAKTQEIDDVRRWHGDRPRLPRTPPLQGAGRSTPTALGILSRPNRSTSIFLDTGLSAILRPESLETFPEPPPRRETGRMPMPHGLNAAARLRDVLLEGKG